MQSADSQEPLYLYTPDYVRINFGEGHPLRVHRLAWAEQLIEMVGMAGALRPDPATFEEMAAFHDRRYLDTLRQHSNEPDTPLYPIFGLGSKDNPVFPGVYDWSALSAGGSLAAARLVAGGKAPAAFNLAGGMHHAMAARASGFCYINDLGVAAMELVRRGKRLVYLDLDAHHGDGLQWAFYGSDQVLTISLHQHPETLFPGSGSLEEIGRGRGVGFNVNIPLWPHTDDDIYIRCFEELVPPLIEAFDPDYIITQIGMDALLDDPLANLNLTTGGLMHCLRLVRQQAMGRWIATGGGGYDLVNVARGWTMTRAIMLGREGDLPHRLPDEFIAEHRISRDRTDLLDPPGTLRGRYWPRAREEAGDAIRFIRAKVFPILDAAG